MHFFLVLQGLKYFKDTFLVAKYSNDRSVEVINDKSLFGSLTSSRCIYEPRHGISNNVVCATSKGSDQPAHKRSLIRAFASRLNIL